MADRFNKQRKRDEKTKHIKKCIKVAAVVILAVATTLTTLTVSVEAVRNKVFDFLFQENEEYMKVIPVETNGDQEEIKSLLPADWENFYYPNFLPEGYLFEEAEKDGIFSMLTFVNEHGDVLLLSQQPADEGGLIVDNEDTEKGKLTINGNPAFWVSKNNETTLIWSLNSTRFIASGEVELDVLLKLAENQFFIK